MRYDTEIHAALSDCVLWDRPEADCAGPRVGVTDAGVILCEKHYND